LIVRRKKFFRKQKPVVAKVSTGEDGLNNLFLPETLGLVNPILFIASKLLCLNRKFFG